MTESPEQVSNRRLTRLLKWQASAVLLAALALGACVSSDSSASSSQRDASGQSSFAAGDSEAANAGAADPGTVSEAEKQAIAVEYHTLAQSLASVRDRALADEGLSARWAEFTADVDSRILENSEFHRKLVERQDEIIARMEDATEKGEVVPVEEQRELATHLGNIRTEMSRVRSLEIQSPEFATRLAALQTATYQKMRELEPESTPEIDRIEELGNQLGSLVDLSQMQLQPPGITQQLR